MPQGIDQQARNGYRSRHGATWGNIGGNLRMTATLCQRLTGVAMSALAAACSPAADEAQPPAASATPTATPSTAASGDDALVPGTPYHAVARIVCIVNGQAVAEGCSAGVKRNWDSAGGALVEITLPGGGQRRLTTDALAQVTGADPDETDGSAAWTMVIDRRGNVSVIDYGPEHFELPDTLVLGR